jgi:di/tricarboxylate transporter
MMMLAAATAFLTPVPTLVNTRVVAPGGYRFVDFMCVATRLRSAVPGASVLPAPLIPPV